MVFVLLFEDNEEQSDKRMKYMEDHLKFLTKNSNLISAAGPLTNAETQKQAGGLWLMEADHIHIVKSLIKEDPFWSTGLRKNIQILEWDQVFADGTRLIK